MKILVVMKRFGVSKDMVLENFGRQIRLFENLTKDNTIHFFCPDYTKKENKTIIRDGIKYIVSPLSLISAYPTFLKLKKLVKKEKYDVIVASTDPIIGIICHHLSKKFRIPFVYELQDNFAIYGTYKLPFVKKLHNKAVNEADNVIAVSNRLAQHISKIRKGPIPIIQNGVDSNLFKPLDKDKCRKRIKLPLKSKIIVYIGQLEKVKGSQILLDAFNLVQKKFPDAILLLSGHIHDPLDLNNKNIIYRKFPQRKEVVNAINSADVAILPNPSNIFTDYCFPYKIVEYMACNVPIVATDVGDVSLLMKKYRGSICKPDDPKDMADKIILTLKNIKKINYDKVMQNYQWRKLSEKLRDILEDIA